MNQIPVPEKTSGEIQNSFRLISQYLNDLDSPMINNENNLAHIREGQSARFFDRDTNALYSYFRYNGKLFRMPWEEVGVATKTADSPITGLTVDIENLRNDVKDLDDDIDNVRRDLDQTNLNVDDIERRVRELERDG